MTVLKASPIPVAWQDIQWRIYANRGAGWESVSRDVLDAEGVTWDRGIDGGGPDAFTARSGTLTFTLNNSEVNSVGIRGFWSPGHPQHAMGWDVGTPLRLDIAFQGRWRTQWIGRADEITPEHGILGARRVFVKAKDWMEEAAEHKLKGLPTLDNVYAPDIIAALLSVMPIQPPGGTVMDIGLYKYPIAFDDVRDGKTTALTEFGKLGRSGRDYIFVTKDGALRYQNHNGRLASTHNLFVLDGTMSDVSVTRSRRNMVNRIEVTTHPRRVSEDFVVLWSLEDRPFIGAGQTLPFRGEYIDPENPAERIGAVDVQDLVAGQDYIASIQQALASGVPDTPATLRPDGQGFYTGGSNGSAADLADGSDATGEQPTGAMVKHSWTLSDIAAASNAAVAGVRVDVRVLHSPGPGNIDGSGFGGFFVLYPGLRLNGIDLVAAACDGYASGIHTFQRDFVLPPGGGVWNVGGANALEFVRHWNWGGDHTALPKLVEVEVHLLYAAAVEELDRTANISVALPNGKGGNATDFAVTNNGPDGVYLTRLRIRGRPVFKYDPVTSFVEDAASIASIGEKLVTIDQSYQPDINRGLNTAKYLLYLHGGQTDRAESVSFLANLSEEHMNNALDREIGDRIGLREEMTGLSAFTADGKPKGWHIQSISGQILPGPILTMNWGLAPADSQQYWHAGVAGATEAGVGTVAGP